MKLELHEIQGIIISGYAHLPYSAYWLLGGGTSADARRWLKDLIEDVTWSDWGKDAQGKAQKPDCAVNVAFTRSGLETLGLSKDTIDGFSQEFRDGMVEGTRAKKLGDVGLNGPGEWEICVPPEQGGIQTQILLILQAESAAAREGLESRQRQRLDEVKSLRFTAPPQHGFTSKAGTEPFGFRDGITQPQIEGSPNKSKRSQSLSKGSDHSPSEGNPHAPIKAGEFILGYPNEYGLLPPGPKIREAESKDGAGDTGGFDLGKNGSYLVLRKLEQDVEGFHQFCAANARSRSAEYVGAKMVGRWPSGLPLVLHPEGDDPVMALEPGTNLNSFNYAEMDPQGFRCPVGAHIRRMNPRDAMENRLPKASEHDVRRHQIIRRGTTYGTEPSEGLPGRAGQNRQGLLFVCINADIKRQFEFIQQTWGNNPFFRGLRNDPDPLIGERSVAVSQRSGCPAAFTIQDPVVREKFTNLPAFVTLRGGDYFFLPSRSALEFLSAEATPPELA